MSKEEKLPQKKSPAPKWSTDLRQWIIREISAGKPRREIYADAIQSDFEEKQGFPGIDPQLLQYEAFRLRCTRLPEVEVLKDYSKWVEEIDGVPYADMSERIKLLGILIERLKDIHILDSAPKIKELLVAIRNEIQTAVDREAKSLESSNRYLFNKLLLGNDINANTVKDSFSALLHEYGFDSLGLESWSVDDLDALKTRVEKIITEKRQKIEDADFTIIDEESKEDNT